MSKDGCYTAVTFPHPDSVILAFKPQLRWEFSQVALPWPFRLGSGSFCEWYEGMGPDHGFMTCLGVPESCGVPRMGAPSSGRPGALPQTQGRLGLSACHAGSQHLSAQVESRWRGLPESILCGREQIALLRSLAGVRWAKGGTRQGAQLLRQIPGLIVSRVSLPNLGLTAGRC